MRRLRTALPALLIPLALVIGILLGLYSGQQFSAWQNRYLPQISGSATGVGAMRAKNRSGRRA